MTVPHTSPAQWPWSATEMVDYTELVALVNGLQYKPGWKFALLYGMTFSTLSDTDIEEQYTQPTYNPSGYATVLGVPITLAISVKTDDSTDPGNQILVTHQMPVPPQNLTVSRWKRWLLEMILLVEIHEAMEFFAIGGEKPFYPEHGPDARLYEIKERS